MPNFLITTLPRSGTKSITKVTLFSLFEFSWLLQANEMAHSAVSLFIKKEQQEIWTGTHGNIK